MATQTQEVQRPVDQSVETAERTRPRRTFSPRTDVYETQEAIMVVADMPGVEEKSLDIVLDQNVLTLRGRAEFEAPKDYTLAYNEYADGDYERSFVLSDVVDREHIDAVVRNGVLRLRLPKVKQALARRIAVKAG
jgi:HSP20 family molecular chaperone IbpA